MISRFSTFHQANEVHMKNSVVAVIHKVNVEAQLNAKLILTDFVSLITKSKILSLCHHIVESRLREL